MIFEETTHEAFKYYPSALTYGSSKPIIVACELCGEFRITSKNKYRALCCSCVQKGKHHTEETKAKLSAGMKGKQNGLGYKHTEEAKKQTSTVMNGKQNALGCKRSKEFKAKISAVNKGANNPMFGKDFTGEKNHNWRGGISFEPYCIKFNNAFKEYIRSKFGYKCFLCPTTQAENERKLSVHHVNYNKDCGCDGDLTCNFVPLCKSCHSKTNSNRAYWQKRITDKLHCLIIGWSV